MKANLMKKFLLTLTAILALAALDVPSAVAAPQDFKHGDAASATSGAATLNKLTGTITSEALVTAAAAAYTLTVTDSYCTTSSIINVEIDNGTNTQGIPVKSIVTPGAGSFVVKIYNSHATQALNGTLKVRFAFVR
jgi:hypothetical protein